MHMVRHQAPRDHADARPLAALLHQIDVADIIGLLEERLLPPVATLCDVVGDSGNDNAGGARHADVHGTEYRPNQEQNVSRLIGGVPNCDVGVMLGQFAMVDGKVAGMPLPVPAAVALWASVSPAVDARLSKDLAAPIRLRPDEWRSGETLWLIDVIGDQHTIPHLMQQLQAGPFKGRQAKMRMVGRDGKVVVTGLG